VDVREGQILGSGQHLHGAPGDPPVTTVGLGMADRDVFLSALMKFGSGTGRVNRSRWVIFLISRGERAYGEERVWLARIRSF
jgi:hypothetical protein